MFEEKYISDKNRTLLIKETSSWQIYNPLKELWEAGAYYYLKAVLGQFEYEYIDEDEAKQLMTSLLTYPAAI